MSNEEFAALLVPVHLSKLSDFMLAFLVIYILAFISIAFLVTSARHQALGITGSFGNVA